MNVVLEGVMRIALSSFCGLLLWTFGIGLSESQEAECDISYIQKLRRGSYLYYKAINVKYEKCGSDQMFDENSSIVLICDSCTSKNGCLAIGVPHVLDDGTPLIGYLKCLKFSEIPISESFKKVGHFDPIFLENSEFKREYQYVAISINVITGVSLILYPILFYLVSKRIERKRLPFNLNPAVNEQIYSNPDSKWTESGTGVDTKFEITSTLSLNQMHSVIAWMEKGGLSIMEKVPEASSAVSFGDMSEYKKGGYNFVIFHRLRCTKYERLLYQMIEHGPGHFYMKELEINEILDNAFNVFSSEATLLELTGPITVIGDLRGQYADFFRWLKISGFPPRSTVLLLGGFMDGEVAGCVELLVLIAALKVAFPYNFFVIRGVTEFTGVQIKHRFSRKTCTDLSSAALRMFSQLPLAATINRKILCVHSGLSKSMYSLNCIKMIKRPISNFSASTLARDILFNLPEPSIDNSKRIFKGDGHYFGAKVVDTVMRALDLDFVIRGRNPSPEGYFLFNQKRVLTLWSATGRDSQFGSMAMVDKSLCIWLKRIKADKMAVQAAPNDTTDTKEHSQTLKNPDAFGESRRASRHSTKVSSRQDSPKPEREPEANVV